MRNKTVILSVFTTILMSSALVSCAAQPMEVYGPRVVYSAQPVYPSPGPGWNWERHEERGYGWRHPEQGWHQDMYPRPAGQGWNWERHEENGWGWHHQERGWQYGR